MTTASERIGPGAGTAPARVASGAVPERLEAGVTEVAVLGAGTIGSAVARRLLRAGLSVAAWDRSPLRLHGLLGRGVRGFADATAAVAGAQVVVTALSDAAAVEGVVLGGGVLEAMAPGALWLQLATIGVEATEALATTVARERPDVGFVDAPVSGSRGPAESGELVVLASGPVEAQRRLAPVLSAIGRRVLWLGPAGQGSRLKLVLNTWLAFEVEAVAEAAALAATLEVAPASLLEAARSNPLASSLALAKLEKIEANEHAADFALALALKDLLLAASAGGPAAAPVAQGIAERWQRLVDAGFGHLDVSAAGLGLPGSPGGALSGTARR